VLLWLRPADAPPLSEARRRLGRPTRLRWLAGGRQDGSFWDAFLAPSGSPLTELASARGRLRWADARPLLEQLGEELAAATGDGTLPPSLTAGQVWVGTNGQVTLLDMPLDGPRGAGGDRAAGEQALTLLGEAAVVLVEGRERAAGAPPGPVRAPLPEYASALLARLLGAGPPYKDVKQFRAALAASGGKPAEVTRPRRGAHLMVQAVFLAVGLGWMATAGAMPEFAAVGLDITQEMILSDTRADLEAGAAREFAVTGGLSPSPTTCLVALVRLQADLRLDEELADQQRLGRERGRARLAAVSPPMREYLVLSVEQAKGQVEATMAQARRDRSPFAVLNFRQDAARFKEMSMRAIESDMRVTMLVLVAAWPALWVLWAFLLRGGLSFHIMGLTLVRGDGRRAARWQCAWRALLVWAPVTALLVSSLALEAWYWSAWDPTDPNRWAVWLSIAAWWAGWALLLVYAIVALRNPVRGPHDRLAGTYLVPR
jgi:hypothetical protein